MLKSVFSAGYGTGRQANVPGLHVAGKTGTTNYSSKDKKEYGITEMVVSQMFGLLVIIRTIQRQFGPDMKKERSIDSGTIKNSRRKSLKN